MIRRIRRLTPPVRQKRYYQLTHDYLVPSLRDWLTRKQKETQAGPGGIAAGGSGSGVERSPGEPATAFAVAVVPDSLADAEKELDAATAEDDAEGDRLSCGAGGSSLAALLALIGWGWLRGPREAASPCLARTRLLDANTNEVPTIVQDMAPYRRWLDPLLQDAYAQAGKDNDRRKQLHTSLALLPVDASQVEYLYGQAARCRTGRSSGDSRCPGTAQGTNWWTSCGPWWKGREKGKESQRLRAAAALATYDPDSQRWAKVQEAVANDLVRVPAVYLAALAGVLPPGACAATDSPGSDFSRSGPPGCGAFPGDGYSGRLRCRSAAGLGRSAHGCRREAVRRHLSEVQGTRRAGPACADRARSTGSCLPDAQDDAKEKLAKRQANAAVALLRMNQAGEGLAALEAQSRSEGTELSDPSPCVRWGRMPGRSSSVWTRNRTSRFAGPCF